jgi:hypothetical protein
VLEYHKEKILTVAEERCLELPVEEIVRNYMVASCLIICLAR